VETTPPSRGTQTCVIRPPISALSPSPLAMIEPSDLLERWALNWATGRRSRSGLFDAVGRELAARSGYSLLVDAKHQPDARDHLRAGFRAATEMLAANRDIYRGLRSMAQLDEQAVGGLVKRMDEERAAGMTRLANRLGEQGVLREDLSVKDAEHILMMLSSFESFDALYTLRGLSTKRTTELLVETAERTLYAKPHKRPRT
jgi:hypothetical protein